MHDRESGLRFAIAAAHRKSPSSIEILIPNPDSQS